MSSRPRHRGGWSRRFTPRRARRDGVSARLCRQRERGRLLGEVAFLAAAGEGRMSWSRTVVAPEVAGSGRGPVVRTEEVRVVRKERAKKFAVAMWGATVAMLIIAAVLRLWDVQRELRHVQDQRAAIKPQIASSLVGRMSVE